MRIILILLLVFLAAADLPGACWHKLDVVVGPVDNVEILDNGEIFFYAQNGSEKRFWHRTADGNFSSHESPFYKYKDQLYHSSGTIYGYFPMSIFISFDKGNTWLVSDEWREHDVQLMSMSECPCGRILCIRSDGLYSVDKKLKEWTFLASGDFSGHKIRHSADGTLYTVLEDKYITYSADGGLKWKKLAKPFDYAIRDFIVSPEKTLYVCDSYKDLGRLRHDEKRWTKLRLPDYNKKILLLNSGEIVFLSHSGSVYFSYDEGESWEKNHRGIEGDNAVSISVNAGGRLICGTTDPGLFSYNPLMMSWEPMFYALQTQRFKSIKADEAGNFYAVPDFFFRDYPGVLVKSSDKGLTWQVNLRDSIDNYKNDLGPLDVDDAGNIYASMGARIYLSTNGGSSFEKVFEYPEQMPYDDLMYLSAAGDGMSVCSIYGDVYKTDNAWKGLQQIVSNQKIYPSCLIIDLLNNIYALDSEYLYKYFPIGDQWKGILQNADSIRIVSLCSGNGGTVLIGVSQGEKVFRSTDRGREWEFLGDNLQPGALVSSGDVIITAGYISTNRGLSWKPHYPPENLVHIVMCAGNKIYGFSQNGMYEFDYAGLDIKENRKKVKQELRIYPCPANEYLYLRLFIASPSIVDIKSFDYFGMEEENIFRGFLSEGEHTIKWDIHNGASGMKIIRMATAAGVVSSYCIIIR